MSWWEKGTYLSLIWTAPIHRLKSTAGELPSNIQSCLNELTMTELNATPRRLDQHQNGWMQQNHFFQDDKRKELRKWMRKKQRERLAVYQKHRESLRQRERKPFSSTVTVVSSITSILCQRWYVFTCHFQKYYINVVSLQKPITKDLVAIQKMRVEKEKYVKSPIVCTNGKKTLI